MYLIFLLGTIGFLLVFLLFVAFCYWYIRKKNSMYDQQVNKTSFNANIISRIDSVKHERPIVASEEDERQQ